MGSVPRSLFDIALAGNALAVILIVAGVGVLGPAANLGTPLPEAKGDGAAGEADEAQQTAGPLVAEAVVHLDGEEHDAGAPEAADERLGREGRGRQVLVRVDQVVVGGVVQEDEAKADGEAAQARAHPAELLVRRPGKDEEANGYEPAGEHHGD